MRNTSNISQADAYKLALKEYPDVMSIEQMKDKSLCTTRQGNREEALFPALLTLERIHDLRLPSILSQLGAVEIWDAKAVCADPERCGLQGSPTRVLESFENQTGKRKCRFISQKQGKKAICRLTCKMAQKRFLRCVLLERFPWALPKR